MAVPKNSHSYNAGLVFKAEPCAETYQAMHTFLSTTNPAWRHLDSRLWRRDGRSLVTVTPTHHHTGENE